MCLLFVNDVAPLSGLKGNIVLKKSPSPRFKHILVSTSSEPFQGEGEKGKPQWRLSLRFALAMFFHVEPCPETNPFQRCSGVPFGVVLGLFWGSCQRAFGVGLGLIWSCFGVVLGFVSGLGLFWVCFGVVSGLFWGCFGVVLADSCICGRLVGVLPRRGPNTTGCNFTCPAGRSRGEAGLWGGKAGQGFGRAGGIWLGVVGGATQGRGCLGFGVFELEVGSTCV